MDLTRIEHRAIIKFLTKEGENAKEIHKRMVRVCGDKAPKYSRVAKWTAEFKHGRETLEDDPRCGRPAEVIIEDIIARVEKIIMSDPRSKIDEIYIAAETGISHGSVMTIIHERLSMSKVSARWVPRNLSAQDRHQWKESSRELLEIYNENPENFHFMHVW